MVGVDSLRGLTVRWIIPYPYQTIPTRTFSRLLRFPNPLSHLPPDLIETIRHRLRGDSPDSHPFQILRTFAHGHVLAALGTLQRLDLESILGSRPSRERTLVVAMIVARILQPASELATARVLQEETATTSLAIELGLGSDRIEERELYEALDWLLARQTRIENKLANKHLYDGTLVLYDVTSS
jgi:hypothetical protein